jgi:hypothetical protein
VKDGPGDWEREPRDRVVRTARDVADEPTRAHDADSARDVLYVCLCGERPSAGALAVEIAPGQALVIGRGDALAVTARPSDAEVWLHVPDTRVSVRHAVVERRGDALWVGDLGSLNGTFVAGQATDGAALADGALVVVGRTVLLARRGVRGAVLGPPAPVPGAPELRTLSPAAARAHALLVRAAPSDVPVLLRGETGTGKEVAARALHALSGRSGQFVAVNCGAVPEALVESELFGVRRGAFSGAAADRAGLIVAAAGGTLLLDEIGELPPPAQVKLLRVLQEREVLPLGANHGDGVKVDFRLVAATHADLGELVARGRFRADLYARVRGLDLELPPLRARRMDLGLLVPALLQRHAGAGGAAAFAFDRRCAEALVAADYPLNVRQLEQTLHTLVALAGEDRVLRHDALAETAVGASPVSRPGRDPQALRDELVDQLTRHGGNISAVARAMRRTRMQVHRWLKRWSIDAEQFRRSP